MGSSKYKTGMFYKACLYSESNDWVTGNVPTAKGELIAAICINKSVKQIDIAIDKRFEFGKMILNIYGKLEEAFVELGVNKGEQMEYEMLYQTPNGTRMMPVLKKEKKSFGRRMMGWIFRREIEN
jgi:hypothetical protein